MKKSLLAAALLLLPFADHASAQILAATAISVANGPSNTGTVGALGETFTAYSLPDNSGDYTNVNSAPAQVIGGGVSMAINSYRNAQNKFSSSIAPFRSNISGVTSEGGTAKPINLTLSGLAANTAYTFTIYVNYPPAEKAQFNFTNSGNSYSIAGVATADSAPQTTFVYGSNYITTGSETSNASGQVFISEVATNNNGGYDRFSAITVSAVPEPSTYLCVAIGLAALLVLRPARRATLA